MGDTGLQGIQGIKGDKGDKGDTGLTGPEGPQGPLGETGSQGAAGTGITLKGSVAAVGDLPATLNAVGDAYIVNADGNLWVWNGASFTDAGQIVGPEGPTGPQGIQGLQGPAGVKGDTGDTGAQGIQGVQGPQGIQGLKGDKGDTGNTGPQGDAASIPVTRTLYVDSSRVDTYVETGSVLTPFKTIQAAIDAATGTVDTEIHLSPRLYTENITINKNLLQFTGPRAAKLTGTTTVTAAAFLSRFIGISINGNFTATISGNCKIDLNEVSVGFGTWSVTATEGVGAGYFQTWGGSFYPDSASITGFNNGLIAINGTTVSSNGTITISDSYLQIAAASFWSANVSLVGCTAFIGASGTDDYFTLSIDSGTTLTTDAGLIGATTITNSGGTIINTTAKVVNPVPAAAIGSVGDVAGMTALDASHFYYCTAAYDGTTSIWQRQALTGTTW
jgi:hypothetical protein